MIPAWLITKFGPKLAALIFWGICTLVAGLLLFGLYHSVKSYFTADLTQRVKTLAAQATAKQESAHDAVDATSNVADNQATGVAVTQEHDNVIDHTAGATGAIDPALRAAGLQHLCARTSYRTTHPSCVQRAAAR
jgi:hypothetical protein